MKVFGHPLHVMIIHFPSALLPMDLVLSILSYHYGDPSFALAAFYCLTGGVAMGALALITGLVDLAAIPQEDKLAMGTGIIHGLVNGIAILAYGLLALKAWKAHPHAFNPTPAILWFKSILVAGLFIGNYLGGRLIFHYHIAVKKT